MAKYIVNLDKIDIESIAVLVKVLSNEYGMDISEAVVNTAHELMEKCNLDIDVINEDILLSDKISPRGKDGLTYKFTRQYALYVKD